MREVTLVPSPVVEYFEGRLDPASAEAGDLVKAVHRLMTHADDSRRLKVRANSDTPEDSERARRFAHQLRLSGLQCRRLTEDDFDKLLGAK